MSIAAVSLLVLVAVILCGDVHSDDAHVVKCCRLGFVLNDDSNTCIQEDTELDKIGYPDLRKQLEFETNQTLGNALTCLQDLNGTSFNFSGNFTWSTQGMSINCIDFHKNGSLVRLNCSAIEFNEKPLGKQCDSVFTTLRIYGASMIIFANMVYVIPYLTVCVIYIVVPSLSRRAYDKAVLCFSSTQAVLSIIIIAIGHFLLCHKVLPRTVYSLFGIAIMILTVSGCLWLLVISFDVASTITKFRWAPSSGAKGRDENHKFRIYLSWVAAGTLIPATLSAILEFSPLSDDSIIKPNFHIMTRVNYRVIVYVITVPILVAISSNVLFIYTTVRMINIQKSTSVANENRKKSVKEKYILYLKLYLLMDAPYITGALGSIFEDLWILKFCRMLQPLLLLYAVLPRHMVAKLFCRKSIKSENEEMKPKPVKAEIDP